jgi:hypothetical protein
LQEDKRREGTFSDADSAAALVAYFALRRAVTIWSLTGVAVAALLVVRWLPLPALALVTGGVCGVVNAYLTGSSGELLLKNRTVGVFVLSSFLRIGVFGIVPVAFAVHGPWWSMAWYFAGFFLPLALFAVGALRAFERK